ANGATRVAAQFDDAWPALLAHGNVRYVTGWLSHALHRALLQQAASDAGIGTQLLADGLRIRRRDGLTFAFNFGDEPVPAPAPAAARVVLGDVSLNTGDVCVWQDV